MFLTQDELFDLSGLRQAAAQIRWLRDHRYPMEIGADGKPRVLRSVVLARLGGSGQNEPTGPRLRLAK